MKQSVFKDSWFQMFAAVGAVAYLVSVLGTVSTRHAAPAQPQIAVGAPAAAVAQPSATPASVPAPAPAPAVQPASSPPDGEVITPPRPGSSDLATYNGPGRSPGALVMAPTEPPPPPPKFTLTGTGVGNTQGIVGAPAAGGGALAQMLVSMMGGGPQTSQVAAMPPLGRVSVPKTPTLAPANWVIPARAGVFTVGPPGMAGADTNSLRDAVYSAASGDLIMVHPGYYSGPIEIHNKSVRIKGLGATPGAVVVSWNGHGATLTVRGGSLDIDRVRIEREASAALPITEPGGAVYAVASTVNMNKVALSSTDAVAPALILERGDKPARVTVEDSVLSGGLANVLVRGAVQVRFVRTVFGVTARPFAAWIDTVAEFVQCSFPDSGMETIIFAYEGAQVVITGKQKPRISTTRGPEATAFEESFGPRVGAGGNGFSRDIFKRRL